MHLIPKKMSELKITLLQAPLEWENKEINLHFFSAKIEALNELTDVVVLPEMFNTGFSMQSAKLAETMEGKSVEWMRTVAAKKKLCYLWKPYCGRSRQVLQPLNLDAGKW
jgi:omega-amidase